VMETTKNIVWVIAMILRNVSQLFSAQHRWQVRVPYGQVNPEKWNRNVGCITRRNAPYDIQIRSSRGSFL
jgi:hypothetical protein